MLCAPLRLNPLQPCRPPTHLCSSLSEELASSAAASSRRTTATSWRSL